MEENKFSWRIATAISIACVLMIIAHLIWSETKIDNPTLIIICLGFLPWLTIFVKKIKITGFFEGEFHDRSQSVTSNPIPPSDNSEDSALSSSSSSSSSSSETDEQDISEDAKKIIATLWKYQKQHFKDDISKRWTFLVLPNATDYGNYLLGVGELLNKGLISIANNYHIMLTNEGLCFVDENSDLQNIQYIYKF